MALRFMDIGRVTTAGLPHDPMPGHRLSLRRIIEAAETIDPVFLGAPLLELEPLSEALGCRLSLKVETVNPIRCFKGRGADLFVSRIVGREDDRSLVCASTGNFGQAMAWACRKYGSHLVVFANEAANPLKIGRIESLGAEVRLVGADFDEAKTLAKQHCADTGSFMVEDGREPEISEGAGSIGVEITRADGWDALLIPVGNGALINGVARWTKAVSPGTTIVGVSALGADAMERSWREGRIVERERVNTIAEGVAVRTPVPEAVEDMRGLVDDMILVDDTQTLGAMRLLFRHSGLLVEPAGALGIAALLADRRRFAGQRVATILTGSNLTEEQATAWLFG